MEKFGKQVSKEPGFSVGSLNLGSIAFTTGVWKVARVHSQASADGGMQFHKN